MTETLSQLIKRLVSAGFNKAEIVKHGLPDWWQTGMENDEDLFYEAKLTIARNLGLSRTQILTPNEVITDYEY